MRTCVGVTNVHCLTKLNVAYLCKMEIEKKNQQNGCKLIQRNCRIIKFWSIFSFAVLFML